MSYNPNVMEPPEYAENLDDLWDEDTEPYDPGPIEITGTELGKILDQYEQELDRSY